MPDFFIQGYRKKDYVEQGNEAPRIRGSVNADSWAEAIKKSKSLLAALAGGDEILIEFIRKKWL